MEAHILVVDDDPAIRELVRDYLVENDLKVSTAESGAEMDKVLGAEVVDLVILDLKLPDEDGLAIARRLREKLDIPIIILTGPQGRGRPRDGPRAGRRRLRHQALQPARAPRAHQGGAAPHGGQARRAPRRDRARLPLRGLGAQHGHCAGSSRPTGATVELTNSEYALLVAFLRAPQRVLSRDQLLESSRLHDDIYDRSIDVQILRLRRKIEEKANEPTLIRTERGAGYFLDVTVETV